MISREVQKNKNRFSLKVVYLCLFVIVAIELIDNVIGNVSDFQYDDKYSFLKLFLSSQTSIFFFTALTLSFIIIQFIFLYSINSYQRKKDKFDNSLYKSTLVLHLVLITVLVVVLLETIVYNSYYFFLSKLSIGIGSTIAAIIFFLLVYKFLRWYSNTKNKILLLFSIAFLLLAVTKIIFEVGIFFALYNNNEIIDSNTIVEFPDYTVDPFLSFFQDSYWIFASASFAILWLGIVLLVHKYRDNLGVKKYYTIISISVLIFIPTPFGIYLNESEIGSIIDPVLFYTITSFNATIAAILFFITFWIFSKNVSNSDLKKYLILTGTGLLLYFVSDQATVEQHAFPSYGLISVTFLGYSAFLVYEGLISSAVLLSKDDKLRKTVHSQLKEQFLYDISLGEIYEKNERMITDRIIKKNLESTGLDSSSLEQINVKNVMDDVLSSLMEIKEEEDKKNGYFTLSLNCIKCHKLLKFQINFSGSMVDVAKDHIGYPELEKFSCSNCGNVIDLSSSREKILSQF